MFYLPRKMTVAECARRMQMNPMRYERLVMIIRENLRPHLSMQTPATRQPTKLPMDSMPADKSDNELGPHISDVTHWSSWPPGPWWPCAPPTRSTHRCCGRWCWGGRGGRAQWTRSRRRSANSPGWRKMWPRSKMTCPSKETSLINTPVSFCCGGKIVEDQHCSLEHPRSLCSDCLGLTSSLLLILTRRTRRCQSKSVLYDLWLLQHLPNNHRKKSPIIKSLQNDVLEWWKAVKSLLSLLVQFTIQTQVIWEG